VHLVSHLHRDGPWSIVTLAGDLDVMGGPQLRQFVLDEVRTGRTHLVLDLTGVDFLDSFGLGVIVGALKRVRLLDGDLRLVVPEPRIRRIFEICDLDRVFTLFDTAEAATTIGVS
jgi:anti-sigma B factor antagonist